MHLLFLIEHLVQELLTIITTLYARFDRTSWGHSIITFALKGGGKESIQMRTYANRGEGNVCIFFFFNWAPSPGTTYSNYHIKCQKTKADSQNLSKNLLNQNLNSYHHLYLEEYSAHIGLMPQKMFPDIFCGI